MFQTVVLSFIKWYQRTLSPDHGPLKAHFPGGYCKYSPSCSEYGYEAIARHGVVKGGWLAAWRIMRCNPWSRGGHDPLP